MAKNDSNSGCGCIVFLLICAGIGISQCNRSCQDTPKENPMDSVAVDTTIVEDNEGKSSLYYDEL